MARHSGKSFLFSKMNSAEIFENVVGVEYYSHSMPKYHELITFKREPANPFDPNAIAAFNEAGEQIGHLNRYAAKRYAKDIDDGQVYIVGEFVIEQTYGYKRTKSYGILLYQSLF